MSSDPSFSCVVVGAGPAGCAAALALRRQGHAVRLIDRAEFPRNKTCGDVLVPGALAALERLGLPFAELAGISALCDGSRLVAPNGTELAGKFTRAGQAQPCRTVPRRIFDAWLVDHCRAAGVDVQTGVEARRLIRNSTGRVTGLWVRRGQHDEEPWKTTWVIAADGAGSVLAADLGCEKLPPRHLGMAWRGYAELPDPPSTHLEIFTHEACLPGCAWVLPVGQGRYNVGLGLLGSHNPGQKTPKKLFEDLRDRIPALARRLGNAPITDGHGWILPIATAGRPPTAPGLLLAGDAAALIDPLTGHGIHNALESGRLAGEIVGLALAESLGDSLADSPEREKDRHVEQAYRRAVAREIVAPMRTGFYLRHVSQHPTATNLLLGTARRVPAVARWLLAQIGHSIRLEAPTGRRGALSP